MGEVIQEIPIEPQETGTASSEIPTDIPEKIKEIANNSEDIPAKRGRGRPAGSRNKTKEPAPKPKPKAKPKPKRKEPEYYEESSEDEEDAPPPRRTRQSVPLGVPNPEVDRRALAADVLTILQQQKYDRTKARRNHYASWFLNM